MSQFKSIEKIDTGILYALELTSSLSVLLLAFGLIASMANVLTKGSVLTENITMQRIWAWTQCIAIDASVAGTIIRTFRYYTQGERVKYVLYGLLSVLLLFTAAIVSNIESVQQTLNIALEAAYMHVFIPVEALIWIRSLAIVLLIVAHALRHVQPESEQSAPVTSPSSPPASLVLTPELIDALRVALAQVTVSEDAQVPRSLLPAQAKQEVNAAQESPIARDHEQGTNEDVQEVNNHERVRSYLSTHPRATDREIARALTISTSTANKWRKRVKDACVYNEHRGQYI